MLVFIHRINCYNVNILSELATKDGKCWMHEFTLGNDVNSACRFVLPQ